VIPSSSKILATFHFETIASKRLTHNANIQAKQSDEQQKAVVKT